MKIRHVLDRLDEISRRDVLKGASAAAVGGLAGKDVGADFNINHADMTNIRVSNEDPNVFLIFQPFPENDAILSQGIYLINVTLSPKNEFKQTHSQILNCQIGLKKFKLKGVFHKTASDNEYAVILSSHKLNLNKEIVEIFLNQKLIRDAIKVSCVDFQNRTYTFPELKSKNSSIAKRLGE